MLENPHPQTSGPTSPSVGYGPTRPDTAQNSPHDTGEDSSPLSTHYSPSTAVTGRVNSVLPIDAEGTAHPRAAASEFLDATTETRRRLLDRLAHT